MEDFICPVCAGRLQKKEKSLYCEKGHCFDLAKSGYVNLLMTSLKGSKKHGDDKGMVIARRDFLNRGYYQPLLDALCEEVDQFVHQNGKILDAGCGECWYTDGLCRYLEQRGKKVKVYGIDISKSALQLGAKRNHTLSIAVGSIFHMPVADSVFDVVTHIFAPFCGEEFCRVLKPGGILFTVMPLERHLFAMKQAIYDKPYENEVKIPKIPGMRQIGRRDIVTKITLENQTDLQNLFQMTPYYYKTSENDQKKLMNYNRLTTELEFGIFVYQKQ